MQENLLGLFLCKEMRHEDAMYDLEARKHKIIYPMVREIKITK